MFTIWLTLALATAPAPYSCGPFLLQPTPHSLVVVIDHQTPVEAVLEYGPAQGAGLTRVVHGEPQRHHWFAVTGLEPDTEYRYRVRSGPDLASAEATFRTLPTAPDRYRFVVMGDHRSQPQQWRRVAQHVLDHQPNAIFAVGTGDYPSDGREYGQWVEQFFEPGRDLLARMPLWPCIGNHERTRLPDGSLVEDAPYFSLFELPGNELWYRFDYGLATHVILDSNSSLAPDQPQYQWLKSQLESERAPYTFVFLHHSPFSSGPHTRRNGDGVPQEWQVDHGQRYLAPLVEDADVDVVFSGHDHLYERSERNGVAYVVTGGAGAPLYEVDSEPNPHQVVAIAAYHYVTVDVTATCASMTAIGVDGAVLDRFEVPSHDERPSRSTAKRP